MRPSAATNRWLLAGLVAAWVSGTVAFATGTGWARPVALAHGLAGAVVVLLARPKSRIVRRGMTRRPLRRTWPSLALAALVVVATVLGAAHSAGVTARVAGVDAMWLHVAAALAAGPLVGWHLATRPVRWWPRRRRGPADPGAVSRRAVLRGGALVGGAALTIGAWESLMHVAGWRGATRRATGSFPRGSGDPDAMPVTVWLDDRAPSGPLDGWTVRLADHAGLRDVPVADLRARTESVTATLDCTGGWYATQVWSGVRLDRLLQPSPSHRSVLVTSSTGYARRLPVTDLDRLWLATGYAGRPLAVGHGAPVRLVAPGRRGFWWVKWVTSVTLDERPWWQQPPFPLT